MSKLVDLLAAEEHAAHAPRHTLVDHALAHAQPVPDLQRALGKADRARPAGQPVVVVQQQHALAALRQVDRQRQAHRPGTDHHQRVVGRRGGTLVGAGAGYSNSSAW
jgi:hypothetical protein